MPDDFEVAGEDGALDEPQITEDVGADEAAEEPSEEPAGAPYEAEAEPAAAEEDWRRALRPGETAEQAVARLTGSVRHRRDESESLRREMQQMREQFGPKLDAAQKIFDAIQRRDAEAKRQAMERELPDAELQPAERALHEVRDLKALILEQEKARQAREDQRLTEAEQQARQQAVAALDDRTGRDILEGLGQVEGVEPDQEFTQAFQLVSTLQWEDLGNRYPEATDEQKEQAMELIRRIEGRREAMRGASIRDYYVARARMHKTAHERVFGAPAGNGHKAPAGPRRLPAAGTPSPQEIEAAAAVRERGAGMRRTSGGGGVEPPKTLDDFAALSEEEQTRLIESGKVSEEELWGLLSTDEWGT